MTWACFAKFQIWWGGWVSWLVSRDSWGTCFYGKFFRGIIVKGFWLKICCGMLMILICKWFLSVSEMEFLAEGEVSLGKNRRQRWEKFINHRTIFFVFFCLGCGVFWKERNGGGGGGVVLNYRGQRWKWGIFPPIS